MPVSAARRRRKGVMFASLLMSCLGASLLVAAFATESWFQSDSRLEQPNGDVLATGSVNFGLFKGNNIIAKGYVPYRKHTIKVVCKDGMCMYSCCATKENRQDQLEMLRDGVTDSVVLKENCARDAETLRQPLMMMDLLANQQTPDKDDMRSARLSLFHPPVSSESRAAVPHEGETWQAEGTENVTTERVTTTTANVTQSVDELEFMDYGLWVATITCLSAGLLMAVVGALFAVVNTATTPVEAITGVPGLYLWNGLAALFDMLSVILWAVEFHVHLSSNVLLYDSSDGWTTEGQQVFGYSFWLVVVAIFVHVANIAVIYIGTWEPKKKDTVQAPDQKGGNIMLY